MGELGALFNPGMRHEIEERQSKAMRREEEGSARKGNLRIDLDSGVAVISVGGAAPTDDGEDPTDDGGLIEDQPGSIDDRPAATTPTVPSKSPSKSAATTPSKSAVTTAAKPVTTPSKTTARSARKSASTDTAKPRAAVADGDTVRHTIRGKRAASRT